LKNLKKNILKFCWLEKVFYFCSPDSREGGAQELSIKNGRKQFRGYEKKLQKSFGSLEKTFYFCTRKSGTG